MVVVEIDVDSPFRTLPGLGVLVPTPRQAKVAEELSAEIPHLAGNLFYDAHTAILMRENPARLHPRYRFPPFPFLEVVDLLQP